MKMRKFSYRSLEELRKDISKKKVCLDITEDLEALTAPLEEGGVQLHNRMAVLPMEGCDSTADGRPGELTKRRYRRFASGGAGIVWFEAIAVTDSGRGNPGQLCITEENWESYRELIDEMRESAREAGYGQPFIIAQLTHAGRYANPHGIRMPITPQPFPMLDEKYGKKEIHTITDKEIEELKECFSKAAYLASKAGFDAVDVKCCHRYLLSDFLSARERQGLYGGSYENRTRLFMEIIDKINEQNLNIQITPRINAYDAVPYPFGWGSDEQNNPDLKEPQKLLKDLYQKGVRLVNISCGNPYYNPHVGRPFDLGPYIPPESQLESVAAMLNIIGELQASQPDMILVSTGFTWLRNFGPNVAAAGIKKGSWKVAGFGRQSLAYPDFAADIIDKGKFEKEKCCVACSNCTQIMRDGGTTGCVVRDREIYMPILKKGRKGKPIPRPEVYSDHIL